MEGRGRGEKERGRDGRGERQGESGGERDREGEREKRDLSTPHIRELLLISNMPQIVIIMSIW